MTISKCPTDPTMLPCGPDRVDIEALHLSINQTWDSGSQHNIHLMENGDISVIIDRGQGHTKSGIPVEDVEGHVIVALAVDGDHDEVHFAGLSSIGAEETIGQALEALVACRSALMRVRKS